ncbi:Hint domain-containing protein [Pseudoroseicyclus sp. CXY001]|uniref:Hint domain-containing protein n=1 Tax=Pseudoroseicyclus sp. CXY001 TaxID=3242492 RepID=UPI0035715D63
MTFQLKVIALGAGPDIDPFEGDTDAEAAGLIVGQTYGGEGDALSGNIHDLTVETYTDPPTFHLDGGAPQVFDSLAIYNATITYADGTEAQITANVFQDTDGNLYLAPEEPESPDTAALEAGPIRSLHLDGVCEGGYGTMSGCFEDANFVPCFTEGTRIMTPFGSRAIETLRPGELLLTADGELRSVHWIGAATVAAEGAMVPIRIMAGALGRGLPERDLVVSPQHRMMLRSRIAERMTGRAEVLLPAIKLLGLPGVVRDESAREVTYLHLLCEGHEVLLAEGAPTESLLTGKEALKALGPEAVAEIDALFPTRPATMPARLIPQGRVMKKMVARHAKNAKPLIG